MAINLLISIYLEISVIRQLMRLTCLLNKGLMKLPIGSIFMYAKHWSRERDHPIHFTRPVTELSFTRQFCPHIRWFTCGSFYGFGFRDLRRVWLRCLQAT